MNKIAIIGATGMLGKPVAKELIAAGFEVTLLARNPEKAKALFGGGPRYVQGDLQDVERLKKLLARQEGLYLNLSVEKWQGRLPARAGRHHQHPQGARGLVGATGRLPGVLGPVLPGPERL